MTHDEAYRKAEDEIELVRLSGTRKLNLMNMGLTRLPDSLSSLTQLESLNLSYNLLDKLPDWIGGFTNLKSLSITDNYLISLDLID